MPLGRRKFLQQSFDLIRQGRRRNGLGEQPQPHSLALTLGAQSLAQIAQKGAPGIDFPQMRERLGTVWIVKCQYRSLREHVGRTQTGRVFRIALDFSRSSHMTFNQDAFGHSPKRHGRGKKKRLAWHNLLGGSNIRHDGFSGLAGAACQTRQRQRGSHQFQKLAASERIIPFRSALRKFPVQKFSKLFSLRNLFEASPILRALGCTEAGANRGKV